MASPGRPEQLARSVQVEAVVVPPPRAADGLALVEHDAVQAALPQRGRRGEPGRPGSDDVGVDDGAAVAHRDNVAGAGPVAAGQACREGVDQGEPGQGGDSVHVVTLTPLPAC